MAETLAGLLLLLLLESSTPEVGYIEMAAGAPGLLPSSQETRELIFRALGKSFTQHHSSGPQHGSPKLRLAAKLGSVAPGSGLPLVLSLQRRQWH